MCVPVCVWDVCVVRVGELARKAIMVDMVRVYAQIGMLRSGC